MQLHDSFVMVPFESISLHLHFTLLYILFSLSPTCSSPHLYSTINFSPPSSLFPLHHSHCYIPILPSILHPPCTFIFPYFSAPLLLLPPTFSLSYTILSIPTPHSSLSLFHYFSSPPLSPTSLPTSPSLHFLHLHSSHFITSFLPAISTPSLTLSSSISLSTNVLFLPTPPSFPSSYFLKS